MKQIMMLSLAFLFHASGWAKTVLPPDVETAFRRGSQPLPGKPDSSFREQRFFVDYVTKRWREIVNDIECLPPLDGVEIEKGVKFNCSVTNLGMACAELSPTEYVDFFEQIIALYEQKRISFTAFENIYYGADQKDSFWSVNWEHPKVQEIFKRILKFDPPLDATFRSMVEDQARGKLADNYMVNLPDDGPLPETLPGIKLQRPFASVIRRYEARTGTRVPPDPNFPDHHDTRPSRRGGQNLLAGASASEDIGEEAALPKWWDVLMISAIPGLLLFVVFWYRRWSRRV